MSARSSSFYDANIMLTRPDAPFNFYDANRPIYTHAAIPAAVTVRGATSRNGLVAEGVLSSSDCEHLGLGRRHPHRRRRRSTDPRSVLLGADYYEPQPRRPAARVPLGIGRDVVLDRVIVDKNARIGEGARLVNERGIEHADGPGYYIRSGIVIVPKDGIIPAGTVV